MTSQGQIFNGLSSNSSVYHLIKFPKFGKHLLVQMKAIFSFLSNKLLQTVFWETPVSPMKSISSLFLQVAPDTTKRAFQYQHHFNLL